MRYRHNLPAPTQGVSTLAERNQPEGMMVKQTNLRSDPVRKLSRRPPISFGDVISNNETAVYHTYDRHGERVEILIDKAGALSVVRGGNILPIDTSNYSDTGYLDYNVNNNIRLHTVEDTTFITNTSTVVTMDPTSIGTNLKESLINVLSAANYGDKLELSIKWGDVQGSVTQLSTSNTSIIQELSVHIDIPNATGTDYTAADEARATYKIAEDLSLALRNLPIHVWVNGAYSATTAITFSPEFKGSTIRINNPAVNIDNLLVTVTAGAVDTLVAFNYNTQTTEGLPKFAVSGTRFYIRSDTTNGVVRDGYYLVAAPVDESSVGGNLEEVTWKEDRNVLEPSSLLGTTMPIVLTIGDTVTLRNDNAVWESKEAGDDKSNPVPYFVGNTIDAVSSFQGRLIVGSGGTICGSRTNDLFNFFRASALQLLATDNIEITSVSAVAETMSYMTNHNKNLVINFPKAQFVIQGNIPLTPNTATMTPTTNYETSNRVAPLPHGNVVFLPFTEGRSSGIWSFSQKDDNDQNTAVPITNLVEGYIEGEIDLWTNNVSMDMLIVKSTASNQRLYIFEQYIQGGKPIQMSWSDWETVIDDEIVWIGFDENELSLITNEAGGRTFRKRIDLSPKSTADLVDDYVEEIPQNPPHLTGANYEEVIQAPNNIYLDNIMRLELTKLPDWQNWYTVPAGFDTTNAIVVQSNDCVAPYRMARSRPFGTDAFILEEDIFRPGEDIASVYVGYPYVSEIVPARQYIRGDDGVENDGKLVLKQYELETVHTREVSIDTISDHWPTETYKVTADILGLLELSRTRYKTGKVILPFRKEAGLASARIYTDSHHPMNIINITWEGLYRQRRRRI